MKKQIVINASKDRSRIAIVEDGELVELYVETPDNVRSIGNVYLAEIQKVMPALRAAFVDVGQKQDCFLHFSDLTDNLPQLLALAGEDVPGLDEPVLSLAPAKRVADDDDEPDVEEALEIEPTPEESRSRRTSRRRSRGRGRGRGTRSPREEEEEQEERPRRALPSVIDLTAPPKPRRAPAPEVPDAEDAAGPDASASVEDAAPPKARTRRRTPSTETLEADAASDAPAEASPSAEGGAAEDRQTDEPTKKKRRRSRRGRGGAAADAHDMPSDDSGPADEPSTDAGSADEASTNAPEAKEPAASDADVPGAEEPAVTPSSSRRGLPSTLDLTSRASSRAATDTEEPDTASRRGRRTRDSASDEAPTDERSPRGFKKPEPSGDEADDAPSPRRRSGRRRASEDTPAEEAESPKVEATDGADDTAEAGRSRRRSRGGRGRSTDAPADAPDASQDASPTPDRSRSGRSRSPETDRSRSSESDRSRSNGRAGGRSSSSSDAASGPKGASRSSIPPNEELLKRGGKIIVKITKEAISNKGPRVSTDLSLAGRFLVLVPAADYVAVSKKIESAKERRRLRTLATSLKPEGFGVIVRTVAEGRDAKSLDTDLRLLTDKWRKIQSKLDENPKPPVLLYQDVNMVSSVIRDLFSEDYDRILVDDPKVYKNVQAYVKAVAPQMADKVELHQGRGQVYRSLGIEKQVEEAFSKRVNMKGGGYLFIETTEAMHVVDVNSGRAGRGKSQKQNLIDVNVEAAREVAKQLRLRDLGGIIVVDFIDLKYDRDRRKVTDALKKAFEKDRAVTKLLPMSDFGLVQITRQRLRPSITANAVDEDGERLEGADAMEAAGAAEIVQPGKSLDAVPEETDERPRRPRVALDAADATPQALAGRLRGWLEHYRQSVGEKYRTRPIVVKVHPLFGSFLKRGFPSTVTRWRLSIRGINFSVEDDATVDPLAFDVRDQKSGRSLLKKYDT